MVNHKILQLSVQKRVFVPSEKFQTAGHIEYNQAEMFRRPAVALLEAV
ncbi:hypothetical protein [Neisseria dumasiana]|nr:hypothetical protein [Neisseria dumasiana]